MSTPASVAGHPIHPMLIVFPVSLWIFSFISDLIYIGGGNEAWRSTALYTMGGGIIGALAAAVPGMIDLFTAKDPTLRRIGFTHMALNLTVLVLFIINFFWRLNVDEYPAAAVWLSVVAIALLAVSGWLGNKMVYVLGAGVSEKALKGGGR